MFLIWGGDTPMHIMETFTEPKFQVGNSQLAIFYHIVFHGILKIELIKFRECETLTCMLREQ